MRPGAGVPGYTGPPALYPSEDWATGVTAPNGNNVMSVRFTTLWKIPARGVNHRESSPELLGVPASSSMTNFLWRRGNRGTGTIRVTLWRRGHPFLTPAYTKWQRLRSPITARARTRGVPIKPTISSRRMSTGSDGSQHVSAGLDTRCILRRRSPGMGRLSLPTLEILPFTDSRHRNFFQGISLMLGTSTHTLSTLLKNAH